jgi:DNA-binding response OmpR family regulator
MPLDMEERIIQTPRPVRGTSPLRELQSSGDIRLLILDDDPPTCSVIQQALANRDFQIDTLSDPAMAESALRNGQYHLIVLDYVLPGLDPDQVFNWIREYQPDANVVVVTGDPTVDSALNCLRART